MKRLLAASRYNHLWLECDKCKQDWDCVCYRRTCGCYERFPHVSPRVGKVFTDSVEITRNLKGGILNGMPLSETMKKLVDYEGSVCEEYMPLAATRLSAFDEEDATIRKVLLYVARDEERHKEILKLAIAAGSAK